MNQLKVIIIIFSLLLLYNYWQQGEKILPFFLSFSHSNHLLLSRFSMLTDLELTTRKGKNEKFLQNERLYQ